MASYMEDAKKKQQDYVDQTTKSVEEYLKKLDQAAEETNKAATSKLQTEIDGAQSKFQPQYDANAVQELISRRQVQETMANMGLTDSGLNRTQQTAIALQRGNADSATRRQQSDYINQLQLAIEEAYANMQQEKLQREAAARYQLSQDINNNWTSLYNAAKQNEAAEEAARIQAEYEAQTAREQALAKLKADVDEWNMNLLKMQQSNPDFDISRYWRTIDGDGNVVTVNDAKKEYVKQNYDNIKTLAPGDAGFVGPLQPYQPEYTDDYTDDEKEYALFIQNQAKLKNRPSLDDQAANLFGKENSNSSNTLPTVPSVQWKEKEFSDNWSDFRRLQDAMAADEERLTVRAREQEEARKKEARIKEIKSELAKYAIRSSDNSMTKRLKQQKIDALNNELNTLTR